MENNLIFNTVPAGKHTLPPLPYALDALEPVIDARTLEIHHDILHKNYVDHLNAAELALVEAREQNQFDFIKYWEGELAFHGSGHILHSVYWTNMITQGQGGEPMYKTQKLIDTYFGNFEQFKAQFMQAAEKVEGAGWGILAWNPAFGHLEILQCEKHQNLTQWGVIPVLVCDVWEHAYYLDYQNRRLGFVEDWWSLINWRDVERRIADAQNSVFELQ